MMPSRTGTMTAVVLLLLLLVAVCVDGRRGKRADDRPALEAVVNELSQRLTQTTAQLTALQAQLSQLATRFQSSQTQVAFLAYHSDDPFNVASQGTLVYNTAQINIGGAYNTATGFFTAPVVGLYVFFVNCIAVDSSDVDIGLLVDGQRVGGCYSFSDPHPDQGASLAAVHLNPGQQVWVHMYRDSRNIRGNVWDSFAGFLVKTND